MDTQLIEIFQYIVHFHPYLMYYLTVAPLWGVFAGIMQYKTHGKYVLPVALLNALIWPLALGKLLYDAFRYKN